MFVRCLPIAVVCAAIPGICSAQALEFQRTDPASTISARGIASADFNRDGWTDLVTAHHDPDGVAVLLNRGAAGGYTSTFIELPGGPFDVVTGDLNKDSLPDIAVANADANTIDLLFGRAEGGFTAPVSLPGGSNPRSLTIGDVDRDGNPDIVFTEFTGARATIYWGAGSDNFLTRSPVSLPTGDNPQGVAVADFDVDGRPDIVVAAAGSIGFTFHFGAAAPGTFWRWDVIGPPPQNVLTVGDFDKDGRPDIVAASSNTSDITTMMNTRGGWSFRSFPASGASPRGITAADFNRDGALDFAIGARSTSSIVIWPGNGAGRFANPQVIFAGAGSRAVTAGDFNHDGRIDVASADEYAEAATVLSNTTAFPRVAFGFRRASLGSGVGNGSSGNAIAVADFDQDGRLDGVANGSGVYVRFGDGRMSRPAALDSADLGASDVNRDGHADIVILTSGTSASAPSRIESYLGDGAGNFPSHKTTPTALVGDEMVLADIDRDGRDDVVMIGRTDWFGPRRIQIFSGNGDGGFTLVRSIETDDFPRGLTVGDVDRDGALDLVTLSNPSQVARVSTRLNLGAWQFSAPRVNDVPEFSGLTYGALGDLNHDGFLDFAGEGFARDWRTTHAVVAILRGGPSGFGETTFLSATETALGVTITDLTLDGNPDILIDSGILFKGHGDGTFDGEELFDFYAPDPVIVDFNKDGLPDIVSPQDDATVQVILNRAGEDNTAPTVNLGPDYQFQFAGQFGDGEFELWARPADADLHKSTFTWYLPDGTTRNTGTFAFLTPPFMQPGRHEFIVEANDGHGGTATDSIIITVLPEKEIYLHPGVEYWSQPHNNWQFVDDPTAASGRALHDVNAGQPKVTTPSANPGSYVDVSFVATNTESYKLWVRLKADGNSYTNDSLWLQFSGAVDANGRSYAPGTTSGIEVVLEECSGCGESGWGWRDEAWGQPGAIGALTLTFEKNGWQTLRIQTREDGVSIDQVVLSAEKYRTTRPGAVKNDGVILPPVFYW